MKNYKICLKGKYDRHPERQEIKETHMPLEVEEILHIDIFSTDKKFFLTCVDIFSKFAVVQPIASKQLLKIFSNAKTIFCYTEKLLNLETINSNITTVNSPPLHSVLKGQVERFHSSMSEIARCLKLQKQIVDTVELILQATIEYNKTIHSVTERKPIEVMSPASLELNLEIRNKIAKAQGEMLEVHNKNKQNTVFEVGEKVFVKNCKRLGNKLSPL